MRGLLLTLCLIGLMGFVGFSILFGEHALSWRQRLTMIVDTPAGQVRGASVTEVTNTEAVGALLPMESRGVRSVVRGEAVAVEVLPGRWLFALLSGDDDALGQADQLIYTTFRLGENLNVSDRTYEALMADLRSKPLDTPASVPAESYPLLVTFDDITKPETVRLVDPDDLDAAFGCEREGVALRFPWREAGMTYQKWAETEVTRLSREMAAERSGLTGPAGEAITETYFIIDDHSYTKAEEVHLNELRQHFTESQRNQWKNARWALIQELPATLPNPQTVTSQSGGQCYTLTAMTLEITREDVTAKRVEGALGAGFFQEWAKLREEALVTVNGLNDPYFSTLPATLARNNFIQEHAP